MTEKELAKAILEQVGGEENINSITHCVTRLRFKLKNESIANDEKISSLEKVQKIIKKGGQYQVVLGPTLVDRVYEEIISVTRFSGDTSTNNEKSGTIFERFVDVISGIFSPVLGLLAASGMIKGLSVLLMVAGITTLNGPTYTIINGIGDAFFAFMPIILGFYAMKKFGGTPMLGALLGGVLVYPAITALASAPSVSVLFEGTIFASQVKSTLIGLPLILPIGGYGSSVMPIIAITFFAAKLEKFAKKIYPDYISLFLVPMTVLLIMSILGLLIVGPVLSIFNSILSAGFTGIRDFSPIIYGFVLAGTWQLLVIFGLHWAVIPMMFVQLAELEAGKIEKMTALSPVVVVSFVAIGAVLAILVKTKDKKLKQISLPAFITGIFGITEPALYGVLLPNKKVFIITCVVSGIMGAFVGLFDIGAYSMAGLGIFALPGNLNPAVESMAMQKDFIYTVILILSSFIVGFIVTYVYGYKDSNKGTIKIYSPVEGDIMPLDNVTDEVFKSETMGKTVAIIPKSNNITSPIAGKVVSIFPTNHALGIESNNGVEVLLHVGIDTVELDGECFTSYVKVDDIVNVGDKLLNVDFDCVRQKGYNDTVIMVITNSSNFEKMDVLSFGSVSKLTSIIEVKEKSNE